MPTTFPQMGLQLPVRGAPGSGSWGDTLDANIQTLDAHDHSEGLGPRINPDGIEIDEDLSFAGFSPTSVRSVAFAVGAAVTGARKVYVGASGDLYYNESGSGTAIQLTAGTSLNVAGFVGGIGGDYTAVSALLDYDDSTDAYRLRQQVSASVRQFAYSQCGGVILMEYKAAGNPTAPTSGVTLASPAALASPYTITMPAAAPGSTQLVQMSSAGVLTASNTIANAVTTSALLTASAGVTCAANQHVEVSGTGRYKHGARIYNISPVAGSGTAWAWDATSGYLESSGAGTWTIGIPTIVGWRVTSITFERYGDASADLTGGIFVRPKGATPTTLFSISVTNPAASYTDEVCDFADTDIADGSSMWINLISSAANLRVGEIRATYSMV